jgi:hypothetical protein
MTQERLKAQVINGETQPLNHYVGLGSCLRIGEIHEAFQLEKIDLHAIPTIQTINASFNNKGLLKDGTVIGVTTPVHEFDSPRLIILDKGELITMSPDRYQQKLDAGIWDLDQYPIDTIATVKKKKKKKEKPKKKRGRQLSRGQRASARF